MKDVIYYEFIAVINNIRVKLLLKKYWAERNIFGE